MYMYDIDCYNGDGHYKEMSINRGHTTYMYPHVPACRYM